MAGFTAQRGARVCVTAHLCTPSEASRDVEELDVNGNSNPDEYLARKVVVTGHVRIALSSWTLRSIHQFK